MIKYQTFALIGGDARQIHLANSLLKDGNRVLTYGLEQGELIEEVEQVSFNEAITADYIILPIPVTKDGMILNAPYSESSIPLNDVFAKSLENKNVYCGLKQRLLKTSNVWNKDDVYDYYEREDLNVKNAVVTAEGAIQIAMNNLDITLNGSKCLIIGYGRIGKALGRMLSGIGADVTISARKAYDIAWITSHNLKAIHTDKVKETVGNYDVIFNTVPSMVIDKSVIDEMKKDVLNIELASIPGGIDDAYAKRKGITVKQAQSLPSITSPKTSGYIIKETIYNMIKEEMN